MQDADGEFWLWPDNLFSWHLWQAVQTQWMDGMNGATGLSYPGVDVVLGHHVTGRKRQQRHFAELQLMERAALDAWEEKRDKS